MLPNKKNQSLQKQNPAILWRFDKAFKLKMTMQSNRKKPTTINIDKINGIENENEIDGYVITDEMKERFSNGISESFKTLKFSGVDGIDIDELSKDCIIPALDTFKKLTSQIAEIGLSTKSAMQSIMQNFSLGIGTWFTPEMQESINFFAEKRKEKQAIEVDKYNNKTNVGMGKIHGFDFSIYTEKENSDFMLFVIFSIDKEDERYQLSFHDLLMSITAREWTDWGAKYYILQKKKTLDITEEFEKQRTTPAPKVIEQGSKKALSAREQNTIDNYRNYVTFYCRHRTELKQDVSRATVDTTKHFSINTRTLQRAIKKCKDILDTNKISN